MENELVQSLVSELSQKIDKTRENQVVSQLEKCGYTFENRMELISFLETRCRLEIAGKRNSFYAYDKLVAQWWDTVDTRMEVKDGSITITSVFGNPPANNTDI